MNKLNSGEITRLKIHSEVRMPVRKHVWIMKKILVEQVISYQRRRQRPAKHRIYNC